MSNYDIILIASVLVVLLIAYLAYELFIHCYNKLPMVAAILLLGVVLWGRSWAMEKEKQLSGLTGQLTRTQYQLKQANEKIKVLEDNQVIVYQVDNEGVSE